MKFVMEFEVDNAFFHSEPYHNGKHRPLQEMRPPDLADHLATIADALPDNLIRTANDCPIHYG